MAHHSRFLYPKEFFIALPQLFQLADIKYKIQDHFKKMNGSIPPFGPINHYVLRRSYVEKHEGMIIIDTQGRIAECSDL